MACCMFYYIFISLILRIWALESSCNNGNGKGPGDRCSYDEECDGTHTVCSKGVCTCPADYFEDYHADNNTRVCRPAPRTVNANCEKNCQPPLVCQHGKCVCWKAKQVGNQCVLECQTGQVQVGQICKAQQSVGARCKDDSECSSAFAVCVKGACACPPGTQTSAGACVATCPDGSALGAACTLRYHNDPSLRSTTDQMDTCPRGQRCVTYGKPDIGHCCKVYCPYGQPDLTKSCKQSDPNTSCPQSTHYCQIFQTNGANDRLCCPRPCRQPTPLYWNGTCLPESHLDDPCQFDEQCEGGAAMMCNAKGRCQCKQGFTKVDTGAFPTCTRTKCPSGTVAADNMCLQKVSYGQYCVDSAQCPTNTKCMDGVCDCPCGFKYTLGVCYNPNQPLSGSPFLCSLQSVLRPNQKTPQCANAGGTPPPETN